jgi:hypothetical protein
LVTVDGGPSVTGLVTTLWISTDPNPCYDLEGGISVGPGVFAILFSVLDGGQAAAATTGTYFVTDTQMGYGGATAIVNSNACNQGDYGYDGGITLSSVTASAMDGTFDISIGASDHTHGTFQATECIALSCD